MASDLENNFDATKALFLITLYWVAKDRVRQPMEKFSCNYESCEARNSSEPISLIELIYSTSPAFRKIPTRISHQHIKVFMRASWCWQPITILK